MRGAVNSPVAVAYAPGQDLSYYVRAAGGPSGNADVGRGYVTQPNGKVESVQRRRLLPDGIPTPRPGSTVMVPTRPSPGLGILGAANQTTQLLAGLATAIGLILALRR